MVHYTQTPFTIFVRQVEHTRDVMSEVEAVSNQYEGLAVSCSQLYFALETLRDVHFLYHFSLRFFQDILAQVGCVVWHGLGWKGSRKFASR